MINHTDTKKMKSLKTTTTNTTKKQQQKKKNTLFNEFRWHQDVAKGCNIQKEINIVEETRVSFSK